MVSHLSRSMEGQSIVDRCVVRSEKNQRENNEDSFQIFQIMPAFGQPPITVLAVADGMGGHAFGEKVSEEALKKISLSLFEQLTLESSLNKPLEEIVLPIDSNSVSSALYSALEQANAHVRRMVKTNNWGKAGSTVVVAGIWQDTAIVAYLGDSPMFHYQASLKKLTKATKDHTVAAVLLQKGLISPEMAKVHEGRNHLEFYVGCEGFPPKEEPLGKFTLDSGDLLLLCSDGVSGTLSEEQICQILADNDGNLEQSASQLVEMAQKAGEKDNQTLILWQYLGRSTLEPEVEDPKKQPETDSLRAEAAGTSIQEGLGQEVQTVKPETDSPKAEAAGTSIQEGLGQEVRHSSPKSNEP